MKTISEQPSRHMPSVTDVIVTTEYQGLNPSGGIGTLIEEQRACLGLDQTLVLLVTPAEIDNERAKACRVLHVGQFIPEDERSRLPPDDQALQSILMVLEQFPDVRAVHVQDYAGIGCRIVQAKRVGLLPDTVSIVVHCHGSTFYLEQGLQRWFGSSHFGIAEAEKIAIERADVTVFPSRFLRDLYRRAGITPRDEQTAIVPYPYRFTRTRSPTGEIDSLIFIGKRTSMKGFPLFLDALGGERAIMLAERGIRRVVIIGPSVESEHSAVLARLRDVFEVVETGSLSHVELMSVLRTNSHRALCVLPYLADNYPLTVLDVIESGVLPILARAGGLPEMVGPGQDSILVETCPEALCDRILSLAATSPDDRGALLGALTDEHVKRQAFIAEAYRAMGNRKASPYGPDPGASVIVPFYNTPISYIRELVGGLNAQEKNPSEIIFVDDASGSAAVSDLSDFLRKELRWPWRIVSKSINEGLAAARQTGFIAAATPIVINVDSDDIPLPNFVADIVRGFARNPGVAAVVPYLEMFEDGHLSSAHQQATIGVYRPLGEGVIASQLNNQLGHANAGFDRKLVLEAGGWDGANRAMWEDYALYMGLVSGGAQLAIVPRVGCLYRVRANSMARTYPKWPAHERIASRMQGLSRFESLRLQAFSRDRVLRVEELENALGREAEETKRIFGEWELQRAQVQRLQDALGREAEETKRIFGEWELQHAQVQRLQDALGREAEETKRVLWEWELRGLELQRLSNECIARDVRIEELEDALDREAQERTRILSEWAQQRDEAHRILGEWVCQRDRALALEQALSEEMKRADQLQARVTILQMERLPTPGS